MEKRKEYTLMIVGRSGQTRRSAWLAILASLLLAVLRTEPVLADRVGEDKSNDSAVVYVETNAPENNNAILAYKRDPEGKLSLFGTFPTLGSGVFDLSLKLGPFDSDQEITTNPEHTFLFAVNAGSNTIAVFHIRPDGNLAPVTGSPFPSGGTNPVSVGLARDSLIVVNKAMDPAQSANTPNYVSFQFSPDGPVAGLLSQITVPTGASPTQALISPSKRLVFGADFMGGMLRSFLVQTDGSLVQTDAQAPPSSESKADTAPLPLGLWTHPKLPILYVGFVTVDKVGVYSYAFDGKLTFVRAVPNAGKAVCWLRTNDEGTRLYTSDTASNTISVYDTTTPLAPGEIQTFKLNGIGNSFQLELDPNGHWLYVVTQRADPTIPLGQGNTLHALRINPESGKLSESGFSPVELPVTPVGTRPQGVVAVQPFQVDDQIRR